MNDQESDSIPLRSVMARYPTGVTVVTTQDPNGDPVGLTVNSFTSLSLDPPLILVCIGNGASTLRSLTEAECFGVSILAAHQAETSDRFAREPSEGRFDTTAWHAAPGGSPILTEATAWIECTREDVLPGGDHSILVGRVVHTGTSDREPLLFHARGYGALRDL